MKRFLSFTILVLSAGILTTSFKAGRSSGIVDDVLTYTNEFRASRGLKALTPNEALNRIAQKHSENMASGKVKFGHDGFSKRNAAAQKRLSIHYFAENVAYGVPTGQEAVNLWKNSEGHRANMLGKYAQIGIGVAKDKQGRIFYTQVFSD